MTDNPLSTPALAATEIDPLKIAAAVSKRLGKGPLNILRSAAQNPLAFMGGNGFGEDPPPAFTVREGVGTVTISGILLQEAFDLCGYEIATGYDRILSNVEAAAASDEVGAIVMSIDSPGGMAVGNMECAAELRQIAADAGKPLIAHCIGAYSAAYALACAADQILVIPSGSLGCIGTIAARTDISGAMAAAGIGEIVAAWPPGKAVSSETGAPPSLVHAHMMDEVKPIAEMFIEHVAARRGMSPQDVFALDARYLVGSAAVGAKLGDAVASARDAHTIAKSKIKRKAYSMPNEPGYGQAGAALLRAVGLDPSSTLTTEQIEAAAAAMAQRAALGGKILSMTGVGSISEAENIAGEWKTAALSALPATRERLKTRTIQLAVSTGRMTPGQAYGVAEGPREFPAVPPLSEEFSTMSLEAVERKVEIAAPLPPTLPAPAQKRSSTRGLVTAKEAAAAGFSGPNAMAEYEAYLSKFGDRRKDIDE